MMKATQRVDDLMSHLGSNARALVVESETAWRREAGPEGPSARKIFLVVIGNF